MNASFSEAHRFGPAAQPFSLRSICHPARGCCTQLSPARPALCCHIGRNQSLETSVSHCPSSPPHLRDCHTERSKCLVSHPWSSVQGHLRRPYRWHLHDRPCRL